MARTTSGRAEKRASRGKTAGVHGWLARMTAAMEGIAAQSIGQTSPMLLKVRGLICIVVVP